MTEEIVIGGGCFWCIEAGFKQVEDVENTISGYAGGSLANPDYREVCTGKTGHAEVVKIEYNDNLTLEDILEIFFSIHNPTTKDREGPDTGSQYRSIILYTDEDDKHTIEDFIHKKQEKYEDNIVTEVQKLNKFYRAEEKHQDYFEKNPEDTYCRIHAAPKVEKLKDI